MMECLSLSVLLLEDNSFFYEMQGGLQLHGILSSSPLYFEFKLMGASRPQTPRCFLVLDYLFSSTRKLQFYVELAIACAERGALLLTLLFSECPACQLTLILILPKTATRRR